MNVCGKEINVQQLGSGKNVLILHGWGYDISLLQGLAGAVADSFHVILADMPGHGGSPEPNSPMTVYDYADIVLALLDELHIDKVSIIGHSFGCRLAIIIASKHPERIEKLVLCGAAGIREKRSAGYYFGIYKYKLLKALIKTFAPSKYGKWRAGKGSADYKRLSDTMKATFSNIVNEDLTPLLCKIQAPVFLIWGENDTATPLYMAEIMEKTIPDCAKTVYAGRSHYAFLEEPGRTVAIIKTFLA